MHGFNVLIYMKMAQKLFVKSQELHKHSHFVSFVIVSIILRIVFEGRVKDRRTLEVRASTLRGDMRMLRAELNQLKQFQTFQAHQFQEMIRNAKEQIVQQLTRMSKGIVTAGSYWNLNRNLILDDSCLMFFIHCKMLVFRSTVAEIKL